MVRIEGGTYQRPLEKTGRLRVVDPFLLDVEQVTNAEFLAFVTGHPEWQRSRVGSFHADAGYLKHWESDTTLGPAAPPDAPVTHVSWFAARAFLKTRDKRLPTLDEWEFAARADERQADASADPAFRQRILDWYAKPTPRVPAPVTSTYVDYHGVHGLHGLVWEWTDNFIAAMTGAESRSGGTPDGPLFCGGAATSPEQALEYGAFMRVAFRSSLKGNFCLASLGFRGARSIANPTDPAR